MAQKTFCLSRFLPRRTQTAKRVVRDDCRPRLGWPHPRRPPTRSREAAHKAVRHAVEVVRHRQERRVFIGAPLPVALTPPLLSGVTALHIALLSLTENRPIVSATVTVALESPRCSVLALLHVAAILPLTQNRPVLPLPWATTDLVTCALERLLTEVTPLPKATLAT